MIGEVKLFRLPSNKRKGKNFVFEFKKTYYSLKEKGFYIDYRYKKTFKWRKKVITIKRMLYSILNKIKLKYNWTSFLLQWMQEKNIYFFFGFFEFFEQKNRYDHRYKNQMDKH